MNKELLVVACLSSLALLASCTDNQETIAAVPPNQVDVEDSGVMKRWYRPDQVQRGSVLYQTHCAGCHMPDASGTSDWRKVDATGNYPPPPLNGTAHTWHHPMTILRRTIRDGGVPLGGSMPGFSNKLSVSEMDDILAWVQTLWPDKIYSLWYERNEQAGQPFQPIGKD
jgi:mono/diheme cytochrome c family protein